MTVIVKSDAPITLVGAGSLTKADIIEALSVTSGVVAADGGAAHCLQHDLIPEAVIGDFDSVPDTVLASIPAERLHRIVEQETTDFDKALRSIAAPLLIGVGFGGARVDHFLAALNSLARSANTRCVLLGGEEVIFAAPPALSLNVPVGTRVSLFPMATVTGRSRGLEWPIDGLMLRPDGRVGTSNKATGAVHLSFDVPGCLVLLPRSCLREVVRSLVASDAAWPAL
ncbi:MAG: thiamine diphosphokinase [Shimia sp.]|nr:thiamine diphosphokinase [Shimia sp.]